MNYEVGSGPTSIFCGDLDVDSDVDIAIANEGSNSVSILENYGGGTFGSLINYWVGDGQQAVFCADLDGDDDLDLAVLNSYNGGSISILKNLTYSLVRGDANRDGAIDIGDVVYLVSYLYSQGSAPAPLWIADVNRDHIVEIGDVVYLINYLFKGGLPPCS